MLAVAELAPHVGLRSACQAFALNRGFVYRDRAGHRVTASRHVPRARPRPPLALSIAEQDLLLGLLDSERFTDVAPAAVFATLLDEGRYHGSIRTMYRLLAAYNQTGERRRQRTHPLYAKPELLAIRPNEVWSWDITKLKGPAKWTCFHLYVILDIYSRYVVGWLLAHRESAERAAHRRHRGEGEHRSRDPHAPCRSRHQHAIEARGRTPHRPRRRQDPQPPARLG